MADLAALDASIQAWNATSGNVADLISLLIARRNIHQMLSVREHKSEKVYADGNTVRLPSRRLELEVKHQKEIHAERARCDQLRIDELSLCGQPSPLNTIEGPI